MNEVKTSANHLKYLEEILPDFEKKIRSLIFAFKIYNDTADDLKQDILLKAIEKIETFESRSKLESWIYRIAINHCINFKKKKSEVVTDCIDSYSDDFTRLNLNPEKKYLNEENSKSLHEMVSMLPKRLKDIVILYNFNNMSQKEIAAKLDIPLGTVWSRMNKAKCLLKEEINKFL